MRNLVHPIGGNITINKGQVDGNAPHCVQLFLIVVPFWTWHQIEIIQYFVHTPIRIERNGGFSSGAFFRSDKDYAVRTAGTVDSGSGSVFKHLHRLYIRCVQVVYIRHGHPVHDEQWFRVVYRTDTSDTDRGGGTRRSGTGSDGYTGSQALQCGRNIGHCLASDFLLAHGRDSPRDITFLHRTVANHYHLIQLLCVLLQGDA